MPMNVGMGEFLLILVILCMVMGGFLVPVLVIYHFRNAQKKALPLHQDPKRLGGVVLPPDALMTPETLNSLAPHAHSIRLLEHEPIDPPEADGSLYQSYTVYLVGKDGTHHPIETSTDRAQLEALGRALTQRLDVAFVDASNQTKG